MKHQLNFFKPDDLQLFVVVLPNAVRGCVKSGPIEVEMVRSVVSGKLVKLILDY